MVIDGKKMCCKCKKFLSTGEFNRNIVNRDGFDFYCKICRYEYMKEYHLKKMGG